MVYFDWVVGNEIDEIEGIFEHPNGADVEGPVTSMDRSNEVIHNELRKIRDFQVRHSLCLGRFTVKIRISPIHWRSGANRESPFL